MEAIAILGDAFAEFKQDRNIDRESMVQILEEVLRNMIVKSFGTDENFDVITYVDDEKCDVEIIRRRVIVPDDKWEDELLEIPYSEAIKIQSDFELGEEVYEDIPFRAFSRRAILMFAQTLKVKILENQKSAIFNKYKDRVGEIISGEVNQMNKRELIIVDKDGNDLKMPRTEQIPTDIFKKGDIIKAIILKVEIKNTQPVIMLSRIDNSFLEKLLENEVPEIQDGLITIKSIARTPGEKAKVAVESYDERIDPIGSCVGVKGSRINGIVKELRGENLDIINYTSNLPLFIARSLSPAKVSSVAIDEERMAASVWLEADQVSLAIGKNGMNIKLAAKLTGYRIDVYRDGVQEIDVDDVSLNEFTDEIDSWMIDELRNIGCDTAKSVLKLSAEELVRRTELEEEQVADIMAILQAEFEHEQEKEV